MAGVKKSSSFSFSRTILTFRTLSDWSPDPLSVPLIGREVEQVFSARAVALRLRVVSFGLPTVAKEMIKLDDLSVHMILWHEAQITTTRMNE
jgi:hypothetical protein